VVAGGEAVALVVEGDADEGGDGFGQGSDKGRGAGEQLKGSESQLTVVLKVSAEVEALQ